MRLRNVLILAAALVSPVAAMAADQQPDNAMIITIQDENASLSTSPLTDRFYTNGLRLGWTGPTGQVPNFLHDIGDTLWGPSMQRISVDLTQQMYTPADTSVSPANPHDRPYAGYLAANFSLVGDTPDHRSVLMLSLGVIGPASGAEALQNSFHNLLGQGHDAGWASQIPNTPAIQFIHERTWRVPIGAVGPLDTDLLPALTLGVGNVRDYVQVGGVVRIGQGLDSDFGVPRIRPGLSGGDAYTPTRPFAWYLFAGVDGQAVLYDILLQNNPFRSGPHVGTIWDVGEIEAGAAIMAYGMRLTISWVAQTPEFEGQRGGLHQFGSASLAFRF